MKVVKCLLPILLIGLIIFGIGCSGMDKTDIGEVITNELDLLKNLDSDTTLKYISYRELFPDAENNDQLSDRITEVFSLFFKDFDYKILSIDVNQKNHSATADLRLTTLDAQALARDYTSALLKKDIMDAAENTENTNETGLSLEERYTVLSELLKDTEYDTVQHECSIELSSTEDDTWEIKRTYSLENDLVGNLMTYLSDPDILSPDETLNVYLKTLKEMDLNQMNNYLGLENSFSDSDTAKQEIALALAGKIHSSFDYEIVSTDVSGYHAQVHTKITTFDSDAILRDYQDQIDQYLSTSKAVIDGQENRYQKSFDILLKCIQKTTETRNSAVTFHLINDGVSWKLEDNSLELGNAILGTLTQAPSEEEDFTDSDQTDEESEEDDYSDSYSYDDY